MYYRRWNFGCLYHGSGVTLTELPKPTRIVSCPACGNVSNVLRDRFGDYCGTCGIPLNALKRKKITKKLTDKK